MTDIERIAREVLRELMLSERSALVIGRGATAQACADAILLCNRTLTPILSTQCYTALADQDYVVCIGASIAALPSYVRVVKVDIDERRLAQSENSNRLYRAIYADAEEFLKLLNHWASVAEQHS